MKHSRDVLSVEQVRRVLDLHDRRLGILQTWQDSIDDNWEHLRVLPGYDGFIRKADSDDEMDFGITPMFILISGVCGVCGIDFQCFSHPGGFFICELQECSRFEDALQRALGVNRALVNRLQDDSSPGFVAVRGYIHALMNMHN